MSGFPTFANVLNDFTAGFIATVVSVAFALGCDHLWAHPMHSRKNASSVLAILSSS